MQCIKSVENHEFVFKLFVVKPPPNFVQLHLETHANCFGHLFNPSISLQLDEFDIFSNFFASN